MRLDPLALPQIDKPDPSVEHWTDRSRAALVAGYQFIARGGEGAQGEDGAEHLVAGLVEGLALFGGQQAREVLKAALEAIDPHRDDDPEVDCGPGAQGRDPSTRPSS